MKKLFVCALLAAVLAAVPAFAQKTYVNGIDPDYPPFAYVDEKTGQPAGFDVDAMELMGEGKVIASDTFRFTEVFIAVGAYYLAMVTLATFVLRWLENHYHIPGFGAR